MKEICLASALALFGAVNAQEYKSGNGDVTVDFGLTGGLGNTGVNLSESRGGITPGGVLKGRYFLSERTALRGTFAIENASTTDKSNSNPLLEDVRKTNKFRFDIGLGLERHFNGTERLSPYVGGDLYVGFDSQKTKNTVTPNGSSSTVTEVKGPNYFRIGLRGVFGADYYFAKRVYLGVEAGLGLEYASAGNTTRSVTGSPSVTTKGGSEFNIYPTVITGVRLGYAF